MCFVKIEEALDLIGPKVPGIVALEETVFANHGMYDDLRRFIPLRRHEGSVEMPDESFRGALVQKTDCQIEARRTDQVELWKMVSRSQNSSNGYVVSLEFHQAPDHGLGRAVFARAVYISTG